jgi:hypothetical protein
MTQVISNPVRTIRPGDLLTDGCVSLSTAEKHNTVGALVGCCNLTAPVYIGWNVQYFVHALAIHALARGNSHSAVVFGPGSVVRERYIDLHRATGQSIRNTRSRSIELQDGNRVMFVYLEDNADQLRGYYFDSVWIVGESNHSTSRVEQVLPAMERSTGRIGELRSGYRGAVRAHYYNEQEYVDNRTATGIRAAQEQAWERMQEESRRVIALEQERLLTEMRLRQEQLLAEVKETQDRLNEETVKFPEKRVFLTDGEV